MQVAVAPGARSCCTQTAATGPGSAESGPSSPSAEKSSQKCSALVHHRARGQPEIIDTRPPFGSSAQRPSDPVNGWSAGISGFRMRIPESGPSLFRSLTRGSGSPRLSPRSSIRFSIEYAIETFAGAACVFCTV